MVFEYSYWWTLPIIAVALVVAYFKFKKLSRLPDISRGWALVISSLRFLVVFVLLFLLLKPALSFIRNTKEKPLLIIAQDNSSSLLNNKDSLYYRNEYGEFLKNKIESLEDRFTVEWLTFGKNVKKNNDIDFTENYTDITKVFDYIDYNYTYQKPEAVIMLSDGIYNTGINPRYKINTFPVYTVALGDTTEVPDVYIKNVACDKFNFIRTVFPIKVEVAAIRQQGRSVKCILSNNGKVLGEQNVQIDNPNFLKEIVFDVEALQKGIAKYTITLQTNSEERSRDNNQATVYVNIIDNSGEVGIYYSAPHPDIAALANAINVSGIYSCNTHSLSDPLSELKANLIVMHNPEPENPNYRKITEWAAKRKASIWYILTGRKYIDALARFGKEYSVAFNSDMNEYATAAFNNEFPFFEFTEDEVNGFMVYPPLIEPFGEINPIAGKALFTQKIKNTVTSNGLLCFYDNNNSKIAYFWGEGLWKWRLFSYRENGNHELFNTLINKIVNYLAVQRGNERFIHDIKSLYDETEEAVINAELYNDSYELVNTPDVKLSLKHKDKDFNYALSRNGDKYRINLGNLSAGEYYFDLQANLKGENFEKKGMFYVRTQNPEQNDMVADRQLLKNIAESSGGRVFNMDQIDELLKTFDQNANFKPVYKSEVKYIELGELQLLGIILLLLICIEWFLLKYFAG